MSGPFEEDPFAPARIRDPRPAAPPSLSLIAQMGLGARICRARDRTGLLGAASDLRAEGHNLDLRPAGHHRAVMLFGW